MPDSYRPTTNNRKAWNTYWKSYDQPWRIEPEISKERQYELAKRRDIKPDISKSIYPFGGMKLSRADVEWLLATHENGRGPIDLSDESQRDRKGLDLRGADLSGNENQFVDLSGLPLSHLIGGFTSSERFSATEDQQTRARIQLQKANLNGAQLLEAQLQEADLSFAQLEGAILSRAQLQKANLSGASLWGANLLEAQLQGAILRVAQLQGAFLHGAQLQGADLSDILLAVKNHIAFLADVQWGDSNLAVVDWSHVTLLGDEQASRQKIGSDGNRKTGFLRLHEYKIAVRANRQLAVALQSQGLNEDAARFAYRAQVLQKAVFWFQMIRNNISLSRRIQALLSWLFSWFMFLIAGYGYRFGRSFLTYAVVIIGFATAYYLLGLNDIGPHHVLGPHHISWYEAVVVSMTAFHGRGFFVGTFSPGDPQALVAAIEAFLGLLIEVTFIATLTQRLFSR